MKKRLMALLLCMVMVFSVTACGSKKLPSDPAELMKVANKSMQDVKSMSVKANVNLDMKQGEEAVSATMELNMDMLEKDDTYKAKIDATVNMQELGAAQTITMYMAPEGDKYYIYMGVLGQWMKMEYDMASVMNAEKNAEQSEDFLGSSAENFTVSDITNDEGIEVKNIEGTMSADTLKELFTKALETTKDVEGVDAASLEQVKTIAENCMADISMTYQVDKKSTHIVGMSMDLTEFAQKVMSYATEMMGDAADSVSGLEINNLNFTGTFSNFDEVEDFEIPEEALNAQDMSDTSIVE